MMESSVKTISRPVIDRLPVNQLDEFACRQLDRVSNVKCMHMLAQSHGRVDQFGSYSRRRSSPEAGASRERDRGREDSPSRAGRGWTSALRDMSMTRGRVREDGADAYGDRDEDVNMSRGEGEYA